MKDLSKYSGIKPVNLGENTPVSFEDTQKFNSFMKKVVENYKIRQFRAIESAKKVIICR